MASPLEKEIERDVCKFAKSKGWLYYKFSSINNRGVPDRIFIAPGGRIIFVEFKRPGNKPTSLQTFVHDTLKRQGCTVWIVDNVEDGKQLIENASWE